MAEVLAHEPRPSVSRSRVELAIAAVLLLGAALWFAGSWIDQGADSTCGSLLRPDGWLGSGTAQGCGATMAARGLVVVGYATVGIVLGIAAFRGWFARHAGAALAGSVVAAGALVTVNEMVRSGGLGQS